MTPLIDSALLLLFAVHLVVVSVLAVRHRQAYHVALVVTFSLLCAVFLVRLFAPELAVGDVEIETLLRYAAWAAAAVTISWSIVRALRKRADEARDEDPPSDEPPSVES